MSTLDLQGTGGGLRRKLASLTAEKKAELLRMIQEKGDLGALDNPDFVEPKKEDELKAGEVINTPEFVSNQEVLNHDIQNIDSIIEQISVMNGRLESFRLKLNDLTAEKSGIANEDAVSVGAYTRADSRRSAVIESQVTETESLLKGAEDELNQFIHQLERDLKAILEEADHPKMAEIQGALSKITNESIRHQMMNLATREMARRKILGKSNNLPGVQEESALSLDDNNQKIAETPPLEITSKDTISSQTALPAFVEISPAGEIIKEEGNLPPTKPNNTPIAVEVSHDDEEAAPIQIKQDLPTQVLNKESLPTISSTPAAPETPNNATASVASSVDNSVPEAPITVKDETPVKTEALKTADNKTTDNQPAPADKKATAFDRIKLFLGRTKKQKDITTDGLAGL